MPLLKADEYRKRAAHARRLADGATPPDVVASLLRVAEDYEALAEQAANLENAERRPKAG
jgi:hypothetical protein